jgi:hypothetical protein
VLPRSIFTADQHHNFRATTFGKAIHQTGITEVWDLEKVSPLFNVPSCVVFGTRPHFTEKPIQTEVLSGELNKEKRNISLEEAKKHLSIRETGLYVVRQGERSFWSEDQKAEISGSSPYMNKFKNGATMYPRAFWFVEVGEQTKLGFNPKEPFVVSDQRALDEAKENYKGVKIEGSVEREFLHGTLLSTDLLPFGLLDYRIVALPLRVSGQGYALYDEETLRKNGYTQMAKWVGRCEKIWREKRREKKDRMTAVEWLDYRHKLRVQTDFKYKVVYPVSATYLCSAVIDKEKIEKKIGGQKVVLSSFVTDYKMFYFDTENRNEAFYLSALLNSNTIDMLIKPMQSRGLWGPRDICKKVLELPIPIYKEEKREHQELAQLGIDCTEKVKKILLELDPKNITHGKIGGLRSEVRKRLKDELIEIDVIVKRVMGK